MVTEREEQMEKDPPSAQSLCKWPQQAGQDKKNQETQHSIASQDALEGDCLASRISVI